MYKIPFQFVLLISLLFTLLFLLGACGGEKEPVPAPGSAVVGNTNGTFKDTETGSTWNFIGKALDGPLAGKQLTRVVAFDHFWFAWRAFFPQTEIFSFDK
jgi:hypothetical protein